VFTLALAAAFGGATYAASADLHPTARDQVHDLSLALRIREGTSLSDGNRHPLFPALLAPVARRDPAFFDDARAVAAVVAGLVLLAIGLAGRHVGGAAVGVATVLLVVLEVRLQARRLCPEPLLAGLLALAAARAATAAGARRPGLAFAVAGGLLGLAWLTKGSALLSLGATAVVAACAGGPGRARRAGGVLLGFVVVASPLLAWNVAHGRSPVFNVNSAHVMWEDAWDVELDARSTATAGSYLARHGVGGAAARLADGLRRQRGVEWVAGFGAVVAAAALVRRRRDPGAGDAATVAPGREARRRYVQLAAVTAAAWGLAMAWYAPVVASRRLLFPVFPILATGALVAAADAIRSRGGRAATTLDRAGAALHVVAAPVAAALVALGVAGAVPVPRAAPVPTLDAASLEAAAALRALPPGTRVVLRPSRTHPPDWLFDDVVEPVGLPAAVADADVPAWFATHADVVLVSDGFMRHRPRLDLGVEAGPDGRLRGVGAGAEVTIVGDGAYAIVRLR